jgi:hypothetical protein
MLAAQNHRTSPMAQIWWSGALPGSRCCRWWVVIYEWQLFERVKLPEGKMLIPCVIESKSNFIEQVRRCE